VLSTKPQWLAKMYAPMPGRDHLGLGSVSAGQILPSLSPGINVLTIHPRYHSLYTFLLDEFWRRELPQTRKAWVRFYRPREFIFSLGCYLCPHPEHGEMGNIIGGAKTSPLARSDAEAFDTTTEYIKSPLGGYGSVYRSVIAEMGLVLPSGRGLPLPVDVPTELGKEVAEAFRSAVKDTEYYQRYFDKDKVLVPREVVVEYGSKACHCQLRNHESPDRSYLLDLFLHRGGEEQARARRQTLRMMLDIGKQTTGLALNEDEFRLLLYFGESSARRKYVPVPDVLSTYSHWRLYQAREYYAFALTGLWYHLCEWGLVEKGDVRPIEIQRFWDHLDQSGLNFRALAALAGTEAPDINSRSAFKSLLGWLASTRSQGEAGLSGLWNHEFPLSEDRLVQIASSNRGSPSALVAGMIALLGRVYLRFSDKELRHQEEWAIARMGGGERLSLDLFIRRVENLISSGSVSILDFAREIYSDYIILQHQLVAAGKMPYNTYRFRRDGNLLLFYSHENSIGFNSARFSSLSTTVHELGLSGDLTQEDHFLTLDGARLLEEGDLA